MIPNNVMIEVKQCRWFQVIINVENIVKKKKKNNNWVK